MMLRLADFTARCSYMSEPVVSNDFKGVGPLILAAEELGR